MEEGIEVRIYEIDTSRYKDTKNDGFSSLVMIDEQSAVTADQDI